MPEVQFHLVDVFAAARFAGNQLAVIQGAESLTEDQMQRIAREFDFSETTFIRTDDPRASDYTVRIFTPEEEIPFAGHPTLGTAAVIREHVAHGSPSQVTLDLPVGEVPVRSEPNGDRPTYWMTQQPPEFGRRFSHGTLANVLGIDLECLDRDWPVQAVSTGLPTVIVPLDSQTALERVAVNGAAYDEFVEGHRARNILVFSQSPPAAEFDFNVRVFAPFYGVPEDPATGSSNGCLAGYLVKHGYFDRDHVDLLVGQGHQMSRPSRLQLRAEDTGGEISIEVGGKVIPVGHGEIEPAP